MDVGKIGIEKKVSRRFGAGDLGTALGVHAPKQGILVGKLEVNEACLGLGVGGSAGAAEL